MEFYAALMVHLCLHPAVVGSCAIKPAVYEDLPWVTCTPDVSSRGGRSEFMRSLEYRMGDCGKVLMLCQIGK